MLTRYPSILAFVAAAPCTGQPWMATSLHPSSESRWSTAFAVDGQWQGGSFRGVLANGVETDHPCLWRSSPATCVDLTKPDEPIGHVLDLNGRQQVGYTRTDRPRAALWAGKPESQMSLHREMFFGSEAHCISGDQVGGWALMRAGGRVFEHAVVWDLADDSWRNLHPADRAVWSKIMASDGVTQGGHCDVTRGVGGLHACLWRGTAESFVDLNEVNGTTGVYHPDTSSPPPQASPGPSSGFRTTPRTTSTCKPSSAPSMCRRSRLM